jgi:transposase
MAVLEADRLVFIDEMGVHCAMTRAYGRAPRGERAIETVPGDKGTNVTVIAAGRLSGIQASMSFDGAMTVELFEGFVEEVLIPTLDPGDVVVYDNLPAHVHSDLEEMLEAIGVDSIKLPAYSPDLNPIEMCWSKIKAIVRGFKPRTRALLDEALTTAFQAVVASDWLGWFRHCGYGPLLN